MRTRGIRRAGILVVMAALFPSAALAGDGDPLFPTGAAAAPATREAGGKPLFVYPEAAEPGMAPAVVRAQADATGYAPPDVELPLPNGSFWPNGFYFFAEYVMYRQNVPLKGQEIAVRGFLDFDGNVTGQPRTFVGNGFPALNTGQVTGPGTWQPGTKLGLGYRFDDGTTVDFSWMYIAGVRFTAAANLSPQFTQLDQFGANTFLFAPVFNFPLGFSGPPNRVTVNGTIINGGPFGIWNGATAMTEEYDQRAQFYDLNIRKPIFETECWRTYALGGPRFAWFWSRYKWDSSDLDASGNSSPVWAANYTNIASNRLYGVRIGIGNECYIGHGLSVALDLSGSGLLDIVKERTAYTRDDRDVGPSYKRSRSDYTVVPSVEGTLYLNWFPYRGFEFRLGYDIQAFFNVVESKTPVDFDFSSIAPRFNRVIREFDGLQVGLGINF